MLRFFVLALSLLVFSPVFAQPQALAGIQISGASPVNESLIRLRLQARAGTPIANIDLEAERNRVLGMGLFSSVSISVEDRGGGPVMFVELSENPRIAEIRISGSSLPTDQLLQFIEAENLLAAGALLNTVRAQEARRTIQRAYRLAGLPFDVPVTLDLTPVTGEAGEGVIIDYQVSETVPVGQIVFEDSEVVDAAVLEEAFRPLGESREFSIERYRQATSAVAQAYNERGFRGSGVDPEGSELVDGVLNVRLRELRIGSIDTTEIGVDAAQLSLQAGDLLNYDTLLEEVRRLAGGRTRDVRIDLPQLVRDEVRVVFRQGEPASAGPVASIEIEGNTVVSDETLLSHITLQRGETFSSALAEEDFNRIFRYYQEQGYLLVGQPDFSYSEGVYTQRLQEVRIRGYQLVFSNEEPVRTEARVITRYLPEPGTVYNVNALLDGLRRLQALQIITPLDLVSLPTETPQEVSVQLSLREEPAQAFRPEVGYDSDVGLTVSISYDDRNLFGEAHTFGGELTAQSTSLGLQLGGSVSYSVPWLFVDVLDFTTVPTSVSASVFSQVYADQPLTTEGRLRAPFPGTPGGPDNEVLIGNYLQRDTGLSLGVGRQIFDNTVLQFSVRGVSSNYTVEPGTPCELDGEGNVVDRNCSLPPETVQAFLPQSGLSSFINTGVVYDDRDNPEFPTGGVNATSRLGLGFGSDYRDPQTNEQTAYNYQQLEFGVRSYVRLDDFLPGLNDPNHVLAFRVNSGHQLGGNYPESRLFIVGQTPLDATQIRGYVRDDILPSRTYLTSSLEYRYNLGLDTFATQSVVGIVFLDLGYASSVPAGSANVLAGAGLGLQINFGIGNVLLPPVRFDYGFSGSNPRGVFGFRIGPVF